MAQTELSTMNEDIVLYVNLRCFRDVQYIFSSPYGKESLQMIKSLRIANAV